MQTATESTKKTLPRPESALAPLMWVPILVLVATVVIVSVVLILPLPVTLPVAILPAVAWWAKVRGAARLSEHPVLEGLDVDTAHAPVPARFENLLDGLVLTMGVARPDVVCIDEEAPIAAVIAGSSPRATIVVTRGLLDAFDRLEQEAVVALVLDRIRSGLARNTLVAASVARLPRLPLVSGLARRAIATLVPEGADVEVDLEAVAVTRFPPGLVSALSKVQSHPIGPDHEGLVRARPVWIAAPAAHDEHHRHSLVDRETPLLGRIEILKEA